MTTHSSTRAWKIPWAEEPGRLQSMGSGRVRHDWATSLSLFTVMHWRRKWQPTPVFLPGESQDEGAWWAAVYGVAQSRTRLKRLSSSSSSSMLQKIYFKVYSFQMWRITSFSKESRSFSLGISFWMCFKEIPLVCLTSCMFNLAHSKNSSHSESAPCQLKTSYQSLPLPTISTLHSSSYLLPKSCSLLNAFPSLTHKRPFPGPCTMPYILSIQSTCVK